MTSAQLHRAAILLALAAAAGCVGFDSVNQRPSAEIADPGAGQVRHIDDDVMLDASKSRDPEGDALVFEWAARSCNDTSGTFCDLERFEFSRSGDPRFFFRIPDKRTIRVELDVYDARKAKATTSLVLAAANSEPTVTIQVQPRGDITVGRPVTFIATGVDDDFTDELTYTWSLYPFTDSVPEAVQWEAVDARTQRLRPDVPGLWRVEVEVDDGDGGSDIAEASVLVVADRPPCIATTDPAAVAGARYIVERALGPRRFGVGQVADDLDPYPPAANPNDPDVDQARFHWYLASPDSDGAFVSIAGHGESDLVVDPAAYAPGDHLDVRVEVSDRVPRALPCDASQPTCSLNGTSCLQRVTWGVEIR